MADIRRQAIDSLRGYDYQIWRSVEAWTKLSIGQLLYLEGAEDFDLVDENGETSTSQIKNSGKNISLGSNDVREAIENFWAHLERNPDRPIRMRFVTRGDVGFEKGDPLQGVTGISLWRTAAEGDDDAASRVARYLSKTLQSPTLRRFLDSAAPADLRSKLFERIDWATTEPSTDAVRIAVERAIIDLGDERDIDHNESQKAVDGLLAHCVETIKHRDINLRVLTKADLLRVFVAKTSMMMPLTRSIISQMGHASATGRGVTLATLSSVSFSPAALGVEPMLPPFCLPRRSLIDAITRQGSPALIVGSEGRGKTTVASLVGKELGGVACWVDLSAYDASALPSALERLLLAIRDLPSRTVVVVDDFPVATTITQAVWTRFSVVAEQCARREQFLILTAKGVHPEAVDPRLRTAGIHIHAVPDLSREEIGEFVSVLGCPGDQSAQFAAAILARSGGGHPKLVHLLGLELQGADWQNPPAAVMETPPASIEQARAFARREAASTLPDTELDLLYSLSLALSPLDREAVLFIGEEFVGLRSPGDTLDRLVGRWVETQSSQEYKITALLTQQANLVWSSKKVAQAHKCIFDALVGRRSVSVDKAFALFLHAWESGDDRRLSFFLSSLIDEKRALRGAAADLLTPIVFVGRGDDTNTGAFDAQTIALLRLTQFRIAKQLAIAELPLLVTQWEDSIARIEDSKQRDANQFMWAMSVADSPDQSFGARTVVHALEEINRLESAIPDAPIDKGLTAELCPGGVTKGADLIASLFGFNFARCKDLDQLREFIDALEATTPTARDRMLKAFTIPMFSRNHLFVQGPWKNEANREAPRWLLAEETLLRMLSLAGQWNARAMGVSAARLLSVLYEDHLSRGADALACLRTAIENFGDAPLLIAQEASVYFGRKDFKQALSLWKRSLWRPSSSNADLERDPHVLRKAGYAAGILGDFDTASEWFEIASRSASESSMPAMAGGALFDAAYCAFKDGARSRVVSLIVAGLSAFERDFDPAKQFDLFAAKKLGGHVLRWILEQLRGKFESEPVFEPQIGQCSNPHRNKSIAELPKLPSEMAAAFVIEIASLLRVEGDGVNALRSTLSQSRVLAAGFQYWNLRCNELIDRGQFEQMSVSLYGLSEYFWRYRAQQRNESTSLPDSLAPFEGEVLGADRSAPMGVESVFGLALFIRGLSGGSIEELTKTWIDDLGGRAHSAALLGEAREALRAISVAPVDAAKLVTNTDAKSMDRLGAVFRLLMGSQRSPETTAKCQIRALNWLSMLPSKVFLDSAFKPLAKAFSNMWREHARTPALLLLPKLSVPSLQEAIREDANAPHQLAQLLIAASLATEARLPQSLLDQLNHAAALHRARLPW
ncbi:tetratricopeptide repeat protein [Pararobbsia alpina]|uniref:tetratricopeptide repeat protein n=1 Tax=Pararobbsia alpina TaxID=621374 RepID=UPI0039A5542A